VGAIADPLAAWKKGDTPLVYGRIMIPVNNPTPAPIPKIVKPLENLSQ